MSQASRVARNALIAVCQDLPTVLATLESIGRLGFDLSSVSIMGTEQNDAGRPEGYCTDGGLVRCCGGPASLWNRIWERLPGWGMFHIAGVGAVLIAGPLAKWVELAARNQTVFGGLSPLGAGIYSVGIARELLAECERQLSSGMLLLLAHGQSEAVDRVRRMIENTAAGEVPAPVRTLQ